MVRYDTIIISNRLAACQKASQHSKSVSRRSSVAFADIAPNCAAPRRITRLGDAAQGNALAASNKAAAATQQCLYWQLNMISRANQLPALSV